MAISVMLRPARIAPALVVVALICLIYTRWSPRWPSSLTSSNLLETIGHTTPTTDSAAAPKLVEDAHKLPNADAFLEHFKAVTRIKSMPIAEAKSGCTWPDMGEVNFQFGADAEWAEKDRDDRELEKRRIEWHDFIDNKLIPYAPYKDRFHGRGIVIVAGNEHSMKRVKVILRALKRLNSRMAIELHYWDGELTDELKKEVSSMWPTMYFNDLSAPSNILKTSFNHFYINYQLKTAAVMNSRFAEPLLLDSDNIPVVDPESLYESSIYKEYNTLFWPDIARTRPNNPMWAITNTKCRMDEYEQESGQLIVNKHKYFYHLQLAAWFNNNNLEYYNKFMLGDKDLFRFAWHALKTKYGFPPKWLTSVGTVSDGFYCGHSFAQHHPNGSIAFLHGGLVKTMAKEVMKWQRESNGGIFQVYKRSNYDERHDMSIHVGIKLDGGDYLPKRPADLHTAMCTDFYDIKPRPLDEVVPGFQKTFEELGGYWMLDV